MRELARRSQTGSRSIYTRYFPNILGCDHDRYLSESLYEHISFQAWGYFAGGGQSGLPVWVLRATICRYTSGRAGCAGNADTCTGKGMAGRIFFGKKEPDFTPKLHPIGSPFRQEVWRILLQIPYGKTMTYGEIARQMRKSCRTGLICLRRR